MSLCPLQRSVRRCADQVVSNNLYFDPSELDEEDVAEIATTCQVTVSYVCWALKIAIPATLENV